MLLLKRLATAALIFVPLFSFLFLAPLAVGGAIAGVRAQDQDGQARDFESGYEVGRSAGAEFGTKYGAPIFCGALCLSGLVSIIVPFSGVVSWCRKPPIPPPLP